MPIEVHNEDEDADMEAGIGACAAADDVLFSILKDLRKKLSKRMNVPPFVIFQDSSLEAAYIRELAYRNAMEIIMEIKQDKKAQAELKAKAEEGEKVTIGEPSDSEIAKQIAKATELTPKEDEERTKVLRVTYKASQAKLMARFFKENGIKFEFINVDF